MKKKAEALALIDPKRVAAIERLVEQAEQGLQAEIERIEAIDCKEDAEKLLEEWLIESHHPDVFDPDVNWRHMPDYATYRLPKRFKPAEYEEEYAIFEQHCSSLGLDMFYDIALDTDIKFSFRRMDVDPLIQAIFDKAAELKCYDGLANYVIKQADWISENKFSSARYNGEHSYGTFAMWHLIDHDIKYLSVYLDYLKKMPFEIIDGYAGIFEGHWIDEFIEAHGISEQTYPLIEARATFASGQEGGDLLRELFEEHRFAQWLDDNNKLETLLEAAKKWDKEMDWEFDENGMQSFLQGLYKEYGAVDHA